MTAAAAIAAMEEMSFFIWLWPFGEVRYITLCRIAKQGWRDFRISEQPGGEPVKHFRTRLFRKAAIDSPDEIPSTVAPQAEA